MMTITEIVLNFQDLLGSALAPLSRAGVTVGDDEWDDFVELAFEISVTLPVERQTGRRIKRRYETWGPSAVTEPRIEVVLSENPATCLVGTPQLAALRTFQYSEQSFEPRFQRFVFRQFGHPFEAAGSKTWIKSVWGEIPPDVEDEQPWTTICIPARLCEFELGHGL